MTISAALYDTFNTHTQTRTVTIPLKFASVVLLLFLSIQLEAFYSIFTTEQQDHVKSVEYLRNNFRPLQDLDDREVFKSAVKDAWQRDLTELLGSPHGTEASRGKLCFCFFFSVRFFCFCSTELP